VLDDLSEQVNRISARVEVGSLPTINADAPQMRQLMQNLISNALKFHREDLDPVVRIQASVEAGWVTLTVADNGIGFDPQYSRRIFRVFERLHGRGAYPGTGIGLALCRKIAERHGGTVVAHSALGEGATFTVTMQTQRTEAVSDVAPESDDAAGGSSTREQPYVTV
jgi:light-regulated signal transduction histidine kinase (bacteriophytochrome)